MSKLTLEEKIRRKVARHQAFLATPVYRAYATTGAWFHRVGERINYSEVTMDLSEKQDGSNIKTIRRQRPVFKIACLVFVLVLFCLCFIPLNYTLIKWMPKNFFDSFIALFKPFSYWYEGVNYGRTKDVAGWWAYSWKMFSTQFLMLFEICFLGTFLGCLFSIPLYYLCSRNVVHSPWIYQTTRIINDILRTIPMFLTCMFINQFFGTGNTIDGVLAIAFFTAGIMYQMMYEYIETLEMSPFEAVRSCGGTNLQCINLGLHPEIKPMFFAYSIYTLEINIRASVILSYVGFGGYVKILIDNIDQHWYDYAGAMLLPLLLVVIVLQFVSNTLVRKLR